VLPNLQQGKNLLAFSAGVDSSALLFLFLENNISFDIALVNYNLRKNSIKEELHAIELAKKHDLKCYTIQAPSFQKNFEKNARDFRYNFFDKIMEENHYDNLLTAHQLNDQLEWFLMRLTKGAGTTELLGLEPISKRQNYMLIRPLLHHSKKELLDYLEANNYPYFIDESNFEEKYERNIFRKNFSDKLINKYRDGIKRSFDYLQEDKIILNDGYKEIFYYEKLSILEIKKPHVLVRAIDKQLKKLGYILSSGQRRELQKGTSIVLAGLWAICIQKDKVFIAPYLKTTMPKPFKEQCRILKIPSKIRAYLYEAKINPIALLV
jgi:tRNA(Ile)-lysidine synthase